MEEFSETSLLGDKLRNTRTHKTSLGRQLDRMTNIPINGSSTRTSAVSRCHSIIKKFQPLYDTLPLVSLYQFKGTIKYLFFRIQQDVLLFFFFNNTTSSYIVRPTARSRMVKKIGSSGNTQCFSCFLPSYTKHKEQLKILFVLFFFTIKS